MQHQYTDHLMITFTDLNGETVKADFEDDVRLTQALHTDKKLLEIVKSNWDYCQRHQAILGEVNEFPFLDELSAYCAKHYQQSAIGHLRYD